MMGYKVIVKNLLHFLNTRLYWDALSNAYSPYHIPDWPSSDDRRNYSLAMEQIDGDKKHQAGLVLGTTPFLRLKTRRYENRYLIDFSPEMINTMSQPIYMPREALLGEKIICENWFLSDKKISVQSLDLIVGDLVINHLPYNSESIFFEIINSLLKLKGSFITRAQVKNTSITSMDAQELLETIIKQKKFEPYFETVILIIKFLADYLGNEKFITSNNRIIKTLKDIIENLPDPRSKLSIERRDDRYFFEFFEAKNQKIISEVCKLSSFANMDFLIPPQDELEAKMKKFFSITGKLNSADYFGSENFPIYILQKM